MDSDAAVVVVDTRQGFLDAIALVVAEHPRLRLAQALRTVDDVLARGLEQRCDVVAVGLDEHNRIEDVGRLLESAPELGVVVLAGPDGEAQLPVALELGVRGWVCRSAGVDELLDALEDVAAGDAHLPAEPVRALLLASMAARPPATPVARSLTQRESAVLDCLAAGMTRHDIGVALELSDNTVRTYVRRILRKLHVHSAPAAVALSRSQKEPANG